VAVRVIFHFPMFTPLLRSLISALALFMLASCGGSGSDESSTSAEELFNSTGKPSLTGTFTISDFTVAPNPTTTNWAVIARFNARFKGQVFPKNSSFLTGFVSVRDGESSIKVSPVEFQLVSGVPGNGTYEAKGAGIIQTGSETGIHAFGTRIDPILNGYAFLGSDAEVSVLVSVEPPQ